MENSRHERALVVAASYVIGFASAFIAFGVTQSHTVVPIVTHYAPQSQRAIETEPVKETTLRMEEAGLVLVSEDLERLLSARKSSPLVASAITAANEPGFAESLVEAELSRDGKFAYFCEVLNEEDATCDAYVYDVALDSLYPVQVRGEVYQPQITSHRSSWTPAGYLTVDQFRSVSTDKPWLLQ